MVNHDMILSKISVHLQSNRMNNKLIAKVGLLGLVSSCLYPSELFAQGPSKVAPSSPSSYEDDRIRVVIQGCTRKLQDLICQATLTSKSSDRTVDLNGNTIRLVDLEGNEYYPNSIRLANRVSENNLIKTELIENVPFRASFVFGKIPANLTQVALLQIPLSGGITANTKFRNIIVADRSNTTEKPIKIAVSPVVPSKSASVNREVSTDNTSVCPDNTKILYRASSKDYLLYICGAKNPTHYVGISKDGTQGITLRLRYYDRSQFSADNGDTNYTIAANRLVIRKDSKVIYQDKIQILQPLSSKVTTEEATPKIKPKKIPASVSGSNQKRSSTSQPTTKIRRQPTNPE
jgi:hypothetical protein